MTSSKSLRVNIILFLSLFVISVTALFFVSFPMIVAQLALSTTAATLVVNFLNSYVSVAFVIFIVGMVTGSGTIASGIASSILYVLKKQGKAKAIAF